MEEGGSGGIPRATSQRARLESEEVADEVGGDHLNNFIWNAARRPMCGTHFQRRRTEEAFERGFSPIPNRPSLRGYRYGANGMEVRTVSMASEKALPGSEDAGAPG